MSPEPLVEMASLTPHPQNTRDVLVSAIVIKYYMLYLLYIIYDTKDMVKVDKTEKLPGKS